MRFLLFALVAIAVAIGCSSTTGSPCTTADQCGSGSRCLFAIGSCSVTGQCQPNPSGPQCGAEEELCGCDGTTVVTGCGFASGFASGPTTGASGPCATKDASAD
ncbi:MAG TPA: hypothetical protein VH054_04855 [Polyangiaceae bacterium]|nr:hypothetical protein [Polyangiaceae bacterium]